MHPALRNVLLPYQVLVQRVNQLRLMCLRDEEEWDQFSYDHRRHYDFHSRKKQFVNEIDFDQNNYERQAPWQALQENNKQTCSARVTPFYNSNSCLHLHQCHGFGYNLYLNYVQSDDRIIQNQK